MRMVYFITNFQVYLFMFFVFFIAGKGREKFSDIYRCCVRISTTCPTCLRKREDRMSQNYARSHPQYDVPMCAKRRLLVLH